MFVEGNKAKEKQSGAEKASRVLEVDLQDDVSDDQKEESDAERHHTAKSNPIAESYFAMLTSGS